MRQSFIEYSMSVITDRALPDVRDGLKPVHRRILYTMHENGLTPDKATRKCADTVGSVLGRYHPHGDASVYDALVRLAQDFSLRFPLIHGQGNFGSIDGYPAAAYRYTEAKLSKISLEMLTDINKDTVDFRPNFDDRLQEPTVLPSRFPNLLVNGTTGIAVGMATNIPSHNLGEVVDALNLLIDNPDCALEDIMMHIKGPDFPTGGIIMGRAGIRAGYSTGRSKIILRARTSFEEVHGRNAIIVNEIPYMVNKSKLVESIANLHKDKRVEGIHTLRDESDKQGMRIVIELKKDANPQIVLNKLFAYSQLQETVSLNMLCLVNGEPKTLTLKQILEEYLKFQFEVITRRTRFDLNKTRERAHILQGFMFALDNIDEVISILRSSKTIPEGKQRLMERFNASDLAMMNAYEITGDASQGLTEAQADAIVQMRLGQLTGLERDKIKGELDSLIAKIKEFIEILGDDTKVYEIIRTDLNEIKRKFNDERRTDIEAISGEVDIEDLIPVEDFVITHTNIGYLKRMPVDSYKTQKRGGRGVTGMKQREEDFVDEMLIASSHDNILFITNKGIAYKLKCYEIPEGSKGSRGTNLINLLPFGEDEKLAAILPIKDFDEEKYICMVTKHGKIKRTELSAYRNVRKNGLIAIGLDEGDEIAGVKLTNGSEQLMAATRNGRAIRVEENTIRSMSRSAHGVRIIKLRDDDYVVALARVREEASCVLTITDKGFGRKTEISDYKIQRRGGLGLTNYKVNEEKGYVCGIKVVDEADDIIIASSNGIIIRILCSDIRPMNRYAKGVKVMRLTSEDERVVAFTRTEHDEDADISEVEQLSDEEIAKQNSEAALEEKNDVVEEVEIDDNEE
ncbi:MAG: DNA gyrase subunit A [Oscillospiraceae bacterium]|nr:DNA gyrase subunit A [Oscillospiraceae bacterium]